MIPLLARSSLRYLARHRWQSWLSVIGIALGVAVVVAVDIANESASRAFQLSVERVAGRATHQIESATGRIPDRQYTELRRDLRLRNASPVIEGTLRVGDSTLVLLGIDPLAAPTLRGSGGEIDGAVLTRLMTEPGSLLLSPEDAARLGVRPGEALRLRVGDREPRGRLAGVLGGDTPGNFQGIALTDVATAQELLGQIGFIDRIDLVIDPELAPEISARLPDGLRLVPAKQRGEALRQMTRAFQTNLTAMSLLALLVGGFIIYNTMTFAVLQRRTLLGSLRTLGCTRQQLFALILGEALVFALVGSLLGVLLGILAGSGLVGLVTRTINDLYFALTVREVQLPPLSLAKGVGLGLLVTLAAALLPAAEAARSEPRDVLRTGSLERRGRRWVLWLCGAGVLLLVAGLGLAQATSRSIGAGFLALTLVAIGFSLCAPLFLKGFAGVLTGPLRRIGGLPAVLAARGIGASISRTGIATAALTVAIAAAVGVGIMIESFRGSLIAWLETTLRSDIYVSVPSAPGGRPGGHLPTGLGAAIRALDGVAEVSKGRRARVTAGAGPVTLLALEPSSRSTRGFSFIGDTAKDLWTGFDAGELILISEPYAYHNRLGVGDLVDLFSARGWQAVSVGAVFRDYGSDSGMLVMARQRYARLFDDPWVSTLGLVLTEGADAPRVLERVRALTESTGEPLLVSFNAQIREQSLEIFDRTFVITRVLRLLAVGVAFVGVLSALMALQLERRRDYAVMRATGMTGRELTTLVLTQTSILGIAAGILAVPLGLVMAGQLIDVINVRSFGWSMSMRVSVGVLLGGAAIAWLAALLAGIYPALRASGSEPAAALRAE